MLSQTPWKSMKTLKEQLKQKVASLKADLKEMSAMCDKLREENKELSYFNFWIDDTLSRERKPIYKVEVTRWGRSNGHGVGEVFATDIMMAKLTEQALKGVFEGKHISIKTTQKKDIYNDSDNNFIGV